MVLVIRLLSSTGVARDLLTEQFFTKVFHTFTAGPEILVTDPPKDKPPTNNQPAATTSTDHEPTEHTKTDAKETDKTKEAGQDGLRKEQEPESMANKNNLHLLWLLLPGVVLFVAVAGFVCYRMRRAPVKEKVLIAKSVSVETGQTFCKDDQLKAKKFGSVRKEPLHMVVSNNRYLYRKRSANLAAAPIQTGSDGYLQPTATDEDWEFPREQVRILERAGEGCFGQVFKAEAMEPSGHTTVIAVKTIKEHASDKERRDLLAELQVMKSLEPHANVVQLLGCCTDQDFIFVIMKFISLGKLQSILRKSRSSHYYGNVSTDGPNMTASKLTSFAFQVARGMEYLSTKGILHRDLAARNVLITEDLVCKVSDLGLARDVIDSHICERKSEVCLCNNEGAKRWKTYPQLKKISGKG